MCTFKSFILIVIHTYIIKILIRTFIIIKCLYEQIRHVKFILFIGISRLLNKYVFLTFLLRNKHKYYMGTYRYSITYIGTYI